MASSLQSASRKSLLQGKLEQLNELGADPGDFIQENQMSALEVAVADFIARVKDNIERENLIVTGKIAQIEADIVDESTINILAYDYLLYQDRGVNGAVSPRYNTPFSYRDKQPPVDIIKQWIRQKGVVVEVKEGQSDEEAINSAAWAMAKKIYREGVEPKNFFTKEIPQLEDDCADLVGDLVVNVIVSSIPDEVNVGNGKNNRNI